MSVGAAACSSLLELDSFERVDCLEQCGGTDFETGARGAEMSVAGTNVGNGGASSPGIGGKASAGVSSGGAPTLGGTGQTNGGSVVGDGGAAGATSTTGPCPGGPEPPATWEEHWEGHAEQLTLRTFDDCVAVYVDGGFSASDTAWLSSFLGKAWLYNLDTYGVLGEERLYVVLHQGKFVGGHTSPHYETTHDGHNVIDAGAAAWDVDDRDRLSALLSELVARTAVPGKRGAPAAELWGDAGFAQIYTYDLYLGLGMDDEASDAFDAFTPAAQTYPYAGSYWFSDFYYPLWRDHGKTRVLVDFFALLDQHYPSTNQVMAPMNWGQYLHFLSGASRLDVETQATYAFGWSDSWEAQFQKAKTDFPGIEY